MLEKDTDFNWTLPSLHDGVSICIYAHSSLAVSDITFNVYKITETMLLYYKQRIINKRLNFAIFTCSRIVHLNFRAGSTFPIPLCTVSPGHCVNKADTQQD